MRVTGRSIVIFVAVVGVASFASGWWFTAAVRETAHRTDAELESLAATLQTWAAAHAGDYPTSQGAFLTGCTAAERSAAEAALAHLQVRWPPTTDLAPVLEANGLPTGLGTLDRLNGRLRDSARRHAGSRAAPATP